VGGIQSSKLLGRDFATNFLSCKIISNTEKQICIEIVLIFFVNLTIFRYYWVENCIHVFFTALLQS